MINRMLGAALLRVGTFEDVEHDRSATTQAMLVVVIVAISSGVGGVLSGDVGWVNGVIFGAVRGLIGWAVWALVTWLVGTTILKTPDTHGEWGQLARGTGFAQTPGILTVFVFIPVIGGIIALVAFVWQFVAMMIAVRQCLDYTSTWRAFFVILISFIVVLIVLIPVAILLGVSGEAAGSS